jgi:hypothetical protein
MRKCEVLNLASGRPLPAAIYRKPFTSVKTGSFILKTVEPGTHTITVFSNENQASLPFSAEAGRNYFFDVKSEMGIMRQVRCPRLTLYPKREQRNVGSCSLTFAFPTSFMSVSARFSIHAMSTADGEEGNRMAAWRYRRQVYLIEVFSELLFNISNKIPPSLLNV